MEHKNEIKRDAAKNKRNTFLWNSSVWKRAFRECQMASTTHFRTLKTSSVWLTTLLYANAYGTSQYWSRCIHFPIHRIHNIETNIPKHFRKRSQKTKTKNKICISEETYKLYLYFCYKAHSTMRKKEKRKEPERNVSTKNGEAKIKCLTKRKNNININSSSSGEEFNWVHTHTNHRNVVRL